MTASLKEKENDTYAGFIDSTAISAFIAWNAATATISPIAEACVGREVEFPMFGLIFIIAIGAVVKSLPTGVVRAK